MNIKALRGINTTKGKSPIILESTQIRTKTKVTVFFLAFFVISVTSVFKNQFQNMTAA